MPFTKFFNASESGAASVDWKTATVFEKLDGSMVSLYWYDTRWHVASSSLPDGKGAICGSRRFGQVVAELSSSSSSAHEPATTGEREQEGRVAAAEKKADAGEGKLEAAQAADEKLQQAEGEIEPAEATDGKSECSQKETAPAEKLDVTAENTERSAARRRPSFADTFWELWALGEYQLPECSVGAPPRHSFVFELMSHNNRILVEVGRPRLRLIGVRDLHTLHEVNVCEVAKQRGWHTPPTFSALQSHDAVVEACRLLNPMQQEGFVVTDAHFCRVKYKSPQYVALSLMRGLPNTYTPRRILQVLLANEGSEFLAYFPELRATYTQLGERLQAVIREADAEYARLAREHGGEGVPARAWFIASAQSPHVSLLRVSACGPHVESGLRTGLLLGAAWDCVCVEWTACRSCLPVGLRGKRVPAGLAANETGTSRVAWWSSTLVASVTHAC
jgi:hypothetical protein